MGRLRKFYRDASKCQFSRPKLAVPDSGEFLVRPESCVLAVSALKPGSRVRADLRTSTD